MFFAESASSYRFSQIKTMDISNKECPICMEEYERKETAALYPCYHKFCAKCILIWLKKAEKLECTSCFKQIENIILITIDDELGEVRKIRTMSKINIELHKICIIDNARILNA